MSSFRVIKKSDEFSYIIRNGLIFYHHYLIVYLLKNNNSFKYGICTGRKIGNAVKRNKIKRRLREIVRIHCSDIKSGVSLVVLARASSGLADFRELEEGLLYLLNKSELLTSD